MKPLFTPSKRDADRTLDPLPNASGTTGARVVAAGMWATALQPVRKPMSRRECIGWTIAVAATAALFIFVWAGSPA